MVRDGRWKQVPGLVRKSAGAPGLGFQITRRNAIVTVKLDIIERSGDAVPAGHSYGLCSAYVRHSCHHDIAEPQRPAHQNDFKLNRGADRELPGAEKIHASGTDVASDEGNRKFLGNSAGAPKTQREIQGGPGVFSMLWMHAHGVRWHTNKTPRLRWT